ncbi:hypothetical protein G6549_26705 [Bacillus sp. MM2020_1]|nr:hypothetical protein [Bacillus sp. MM2020_1]
MNISLVKEWYNTQETAEILGITTCVILSRINNRKSSLIEIKEVEYKKEKRKYLIHKDYIYRCNKEATEKVWFPISEASKLLGKSETWLRNKVDKGGIPKTAYQNTGKLLININYINEQKQYFTMIEKNYYTYEEVSLVLGKSWYCIDGMVIRGTFKDVITSIVPNYISKKEVHNYKEMTKDTIVTSIIQSELNLSEHQALEFIKTEPLIVANNVSGQQFYVKQESYGKFKEGLVYTTKLASEFLKIDYEIVKMLMEKKHIQVFNVKGLGLRTSKYYLEEYLKKDEIPLEQLAMEMGKKVNVLQPYIESGELKKLASYKRHYLRRKDADEFKFSLTAIRIKYFNTDNFQDLFNDVILFLQNTTEFKETVDLFNIWARNRINQSKLKKKINLVNRLLNSFISLISNMDKELFFYTDDELKVLFKTLLDSHFFSLYLFLNYCKIKRKCNFNGDYIGRNKKNKEVKPYTKKEWCNLTLDVLDIEKHFEKAIESKKYAEIWLWTLIQFSLDWRKEDLKEIKQINLDIVGIDCFEWFDFNTVTLEIAHTILKTVERSLKGVKASKNKEELIFVVPFIFEMPTALAIILCELHRRLINKDEIKLITSNFRKKDLCAFFGEELPEFSNRKCSKTLTTYGWETAVKKGKGALAYWLGGFARSHKHKIDIPNPVTQIYIFTKNTDASVEEMALHAFERGIFGWQVKVMIDTLNNHEPLNLIEMTKAIGDVNRAYSPMMVDSLSKYAVTRHEQSVLLLKELMTVPKSELKKKLEEISKLKSPSLLDHSQCLVGVKKCPYLKEVEYNLETPCLGCKNRIDTNYIMDIVNVELFSLMDRLKETPISDETSRIKYTHMIRTLVYILLDFRRAYDKYDENYIRSFIDLDELNKKYRELEFTKFLRIE